MMRLVVRVEHTCLDGSPFPVVFAHADDVRSRWVIDREHAPTAMTPLADAVRRSGRLGEVRAFADCGVTPPSMLERARPVANGYAYHPEVDLAPAERERSSAELVALSRRHDSTLGVWRDHCLPRIEVACIWLCDAPPGTPFATLAEQREYAWGLTSVAGLAARIDEQAVVASCGPAFGDRATEVARELAQGSQNETTAADLAIGRMARMVPGSVELAAVRAEFLATFGSRAVSWSIDHPTVAEQPGLLDAQVAMLRRHGLGDLGAILRSATTRRRDLAAQVEATLADQTERASFRRRLDRLAAFVPVREARARWQLVASGALRGTVLERGRRLVDQGVLDEVEDVFYLTPDEFDTPSNDLRPAVVTRRAEHRHWLTMTPPAAIGATADAGVAKVRGDAGPTHERMLHGRPGAPGVTAGPARVILELDDVDRLEPGDILVTTMTSPAWTPLFALAAAVVTDAGDGLSHVAIAAREYGIACVAGTDLATVLISDGDWLGVDGGAGTVRIVRRA